MKTVPGVIAVAERQLLLCCRKQDESFRFQSLCSQNLARIMIIKFWSEGKPIKDV